MLALTILFLHSTLLWQIVTCVKNTEVGSDLINFGRWSGIKNLMTLIGHNMSDQRIITKIWSERRTDFAMCSIK